MNSSQIENLPRRIGINRLFTKLWVATGASNLVDGINLAAAPLLAAALTRDPVLVAGLTVAQRLPWFLFSVISGAIVDRFDRRKIIVVGNAIRATAIGGLGIVIAAGWVTLPILYLVFFLLGIAETLFDNATFAILPSVVPDDEIEKANGRIFSTQTVMNEFIGAPLGGFLFATAAAIPFFVGAGSYAASAVFVLLMSGQFRAQDAKDNIQTTLQNEISDGVRWFWNHPLLRTLGLMAGAANFVYAATWGILVLFAQNILGLEAAGYGLLLGSAAVGGIVGGMSATWLANQSRTGTMIFITNLLAATSYAAIAFVKTPALAAILLAFISFVVMVQNVVVVSLRQMIIPDELLGRVTSVYRMFALGALPLGALFGGFIARSYGLTTPFLVGGLFFVLVSFLILPIVNNRVIAEVRNVGSTEG